MQVNLAATALSALGLEAIGSGKSEEASDIAFASQTEAAATTAPNQKDLTTVDEALVSVLARAFNPAPETEARMAQPSNTEAVNGTEADPADAPIFTTVAEATPDGTEAAANKIPALPMPAIGNVAWTQESDLANFGTTAAGTPVAVEAQETSVAGASTVPPHADPEASSPLPAFVPAEESEAAYQAKAPIAPETEAASVPAKPNPDHGITPTTVRERASTEAANAPQTTARPLPPKLENLLSRMPSELREAITSVREMAYTMLNRGSRVGEVVSAIRAAVAAAVRESTHPSSAAHARVSTGALVAEAVTHFRREALIGSPATSVAEEATTVASRLAEPVEDVPMAPETEAAFADSPLLSKSTDRPMTDIDTLFQRESSEVGAAVERVKTTVAPERSAGEVPTDVRSTPVSMVAASSASEPSAVAQRTTEARFAPVIQKVTEEIATLASSASRKSLTIRLDPPELGTVDITIHSRGSKIEAHVLASSSDVRTALQVHRNTLTEALAQHGLELSSLLVGDDRSGSSAHRFTEAAYQAPAYRFEPESAVAEAVARSAARWNLDSTALDMRV